MAITGEDTVIIKINPVVEKQAAEKAIESITKQITVLRTNNVALRKTIKDTNGESVAEAVQLAKNEAALKKLNQQRNQAIKVIGAEVGSVNSAKAAVSGLTKERDALNISTQEGRDEANRLNEEILKQTNLIKKVNEEGGNFRDSVGNYAIAAQAAKGDIFQLTKTQVELDKSLKKVAESNAKLREEIKLTNRETVEGNERFTELNDQLNTNDKEYKILTDALIKNKEAIEKNQNELEKSILNFKVFGISINSFTKFIGIARGGILNLIKSLISLRIALIATGVGAFVVIVGSLVAFLKKTSEGTRILNEYLSGLGQIFNVLIKRASVIGELLVKVIRDPIKYLKEYGQLFLDNVLNRFKAFGEIVQAILSLDIKRYINGWLQLTTGFSNVIDKSLSLKDSIKVLAEELGKAYERGIKFAKLSEELAKNEREINKQLVIREGERNRLIKLSEDEKQADEDRIKALQDANALESFSREEIISLREKELNFIKEKAKEEGNLTEAIEKIAEKENELQKLRDENEIKNIEAYRNENSLIDSLTAKRKEANDKLRNDEYELEKFRLEQGLKQEENYEERLKRFTELEELRREKLLENEKLTEDGRQLIIEQSEDRINEFKKTLEEQEKERKNKELQDNIDLEIAKRELRIESLKNEASKLEERRAIQELNNQKLLANEKLTAKERQKIETDNKKELQRIDNELANERKKALNDFTKTLTENLDEQTEIGKAAAIFQKGIQTKEVIIDTQQAAIGAYKALAGIPIVGPELGIAAAAAAIAYGAKRVADINAIKYERGGLLKGKRHKDGGIDGIFNNQPIEMEDSEFIINRDATMNNIDAITKINSYGSRYKFDAVPIAKTYQDGGIIGGSSFQDSIILNQSISIENNQNLQDSLELIVKNMPRQVLVVETFEEVQQQIQVAETKSTFF